VSADQQTFADARALVRAFGVAFTAQRVYGARHPQTRAARKAFVRLAREAPTTRLLLQSGTLAWEGIPLRGNSTFASIAERLAERNCVGLQIEASVFDEEVGAVVSWLNGTQETEHAPECRGLRLLFGMQEPDVEEPYPEFTSKYPEFRLPLILYEETARCLGSAMSQAASNGQIDVDQVTRVATRVADAICADGLQMLGPIHLLRSDTHTWQHSVNVFLISLNVLQHVVRDRDELVVFGQAALLHDIGKSRIPSWILNKPGNLTDDERNIMKRHTEFGAEILGAHDDVHPIACEVAYCHHMRDEGRGYPVPVLRLRPGPVTDVVQVADMFEALSAWRSYKEPLGFKDAIKTIRTTPGMASKEPALTMLVRKMSPCPPGAEVTLVTGEKGIVVEVLADRPGCPVVVRIGADAEGNELERPARVEFEPDDPRIERVVVRPGALGAPIKA